MPSSVITLKHVSKEFSLNSTKPTFIEKLSPSKYYVFPALTDINLTVKQGERIGLIGNNGSGKTTLLKIIAGITKPTSGNVNISGKVLSLISLTAGFDLELTGKENVLLQASLLGSPSTQTLPIMNQIIKYAGLGEFINQPLYTYSSGMLLRLGFSIIIHLQADIYLFDEFLTVGDSDFQHQCQLSLATLKEKGKTILIASQNLNMLLPICSHILTLEKGYLYNKNPLTPSLLAFYKRAITKNPATTAIISNSMAPTLILGDNVSFHHRPIKQIQVGDIIAFAFHNMPQLICHRVTGITITKKGNAFITKGDANQTIDPWLVGDQEYVGVISIKNGKNI